MSTGSCWSCCSHMSRARDVLKPRVAWMIRLSGSARWFVEGPVARLVRSGHGSGRAQAVSRSRRGLRRSALRLG